VRRNKSILVALLLATPFLYFASYSQEEFVPPVAKLLTSFYFQQYNGGIVVLQATLDNHKDSLHFILDTGSGGISLDSTTVDELQLTTSASDKTIRGIAGVHNVRFAYNHRLNIPGLSVDSLDFHINDYSILSSVYGQRVDGIIGYSFFNRYIVKINYDSNKIQVYSKGLIKYPRGGYLLKPLLASLLMQTASLKDARRLVARFYFDIGAGLNILFSKDFVKDSSFLPSRRKQVPTQVEGLGGKKQMILTTVKEFKLGPYKFKRVPAYIFEDEYNITAYPYLAGLIGNDLLRRFNVIFNYEKRDIYITPNSHFREPFDYSYTGFSFYAVNGDIVVAEIMDHSPATAAGFKEGDKIIAINNNLTRNIQVYRNMLQNANERFKVLVSRNGVLITLWLKVKSIK
jgi:hypothetical protein